MPVYFPEGISEKSFAATLLLCFFLGIFGAHHFYTGKTGIGVVYLVATLCVIGIPVIGIMSIVDFFVILSGSFRDEYGFFVRAR